MLTQLELCRSLFERLKETSDFLDELNDTEKSVSFYEEEFNLIIDLVDIWEDLMHNLDILEKEDQFAFIAKRIRKNSNTFMTKHKLFLED